ncbi:MAG TPA: cytochrome c oxidase assembly protein [Vicinamibacterales bacterium]|nr:cytochrome c oxidase assembly protein [Vicinamibacterales bacterium]
MTESLLLASPWKADVYAAAALLSSGALYVAGSWRVLRRATGEHRRALRQAIAAFTIGWAMLGLALLSPIAVVADVLFSWHMTQHELLMLVAAPFIALGRPLAPMVAALPSRLRRPAAHVLSSRAAERITTPLAVFLIHAVLLWMWHVPVLFEAAVRDERIHLLQHVSFAGSACLFWWTMLHGRYGRTGYGVAVFYVFATAIHSGSLGALAAFSERPWYPLYVQSAAHTHDALVDQQLAGLIMWIPSGVTMMLFGLGIFAAWLGHAEHRRQRGWSSSSWRTP